MCRRGLFRRCFAEIGGEDLERNPHFRVFQNSSSRWRSNRPPRPWRTQAPRSGSDPRPSIFDQGRNTFFFSSRRPRFPKECRDGDQTVLAQRFCFVSIPLEIPAVVFQVLESAEGHAPLDASREGAVLVVREVHSGALRTRRSIWTNSGSPAAQSPPEARCRPGNRARGPPIAARSRPVATQNRHTAAMAFRGMLSNFAVCIS